MSVPMPALTRVATPMSMAIARKARSRPRRCLARSAYAHRDADADAESDTDTDTDRAHTDTHTHAAAHLPLSTPTHTYIYITYISLNMNDTYIETYAVCVCRRADDVVDVIDARDEQGCTPLVLAAQHGLLGALRLLIQRGADLDLPQARLHDIYI